MGLWLPPIYAHDIKLLVVTVRCCFWKSPISMIVSCWRYCIDNSLFHVTWSLCKA
ncbi:hypothetical protein ES332_D11G398800v1 [Gossypium tomentosum]|uniref:Uncharacterized protein n=1 Tax=Gossypium tomentosum TaxID=34277 RepID=A0A5D2IX67_GOSTO|nr:hypothetical protein ES332_D11G398800v1 [Gossypium tomentosum]